MPYSLLSKIFLLSYVQHQSNVAKCNAAYCRPGPLGTSGRAVPDRSMPTEHDWTNRPQSAAHFVHSNIWQCPEKWRSQPGCLCRRSAESLHRWNRNHSDRARYEGREVLIASDCPLYAPTTSINHGSGSLTPILFSCPFWAILEGLTKLFSWYLGFIFLIANLFSDFFSDFFSFLFVVLWFFLADRRFSFTASMLCISRWITPDCRL